MMKKLMAILLAATVAFGLVGCATTPDEGPADNTPPAEETGIPLQRTFAPVVKVSKTGKATWTSLENAQEFIYKINDGEEVRTSEKSVQLQPNDKIVVKCLGDGVTRRDSRWSDSQRYLSRRSYVVDGFGQDSNTVNIYKPDGTVVLDSIAGTKTQGDVLEIGQEYIFEIDVTVGSYHNGLLLAGVDNAVLSDLVWSDSAYTARAGEVSETDVFKEVLYNTNYLIYPNYAELHRLEWDYSLNTYAWKLKDEVATNTNGVYDTRKEGFWTVEPNYCATLYGQHILGSSKDSREQIEAGYKYVRFKIKYDSFNRMGTGVIDSGEDYGSLLGREDFNLFIKLHNTVSMVYFDSNDKTEYEDRDYSMVKGDDGKAATGVNIYDAASGEVLLGAMTNANAKGKLLEAGKKYVFEFDVTGTKNGPVVFTGVNEAYISEVTWSDKLYSERSGENALPDNLGILNLDNHHLAADEPLFHRLWKSADGYQANYLRHNVMQNGVADTAKERATGAQYNRCMSFALHQWFGSEKAAKQANRQYFRMTIEFQKINTIGVGAAITDQSSPDYGRLAATNFNMFVYSPAGGRYLYFQAYSD